ncbi:hypothetical protein ACYRFS_06960 [Listeria kieliensis]
MKKKIFAFALTGVIAVSSILPVVSYAAETWNRGYNKSTMQWYNHYRHSGYRHFGAITKNGVTYKGPTAAPGYWSKLNLKFNGPYRVTYSKHIIR